MSTFRKNDKVNFTDFQRYLNGTKNGKNDNIFLWDIDSENIPNINPKVFTVTDVLVDNKYNLSYNNELLFNINEKEIKHDTSRPGRIGVLAAVKPVIPPFIPAAAKPIVPPVVPPAAKPIVPPAVAPIVKPVFRIMSKIKFKTSNGNIFITVTNDKGEKRNKMYNKNEIKYFNDEYEMFYAGPADKDYNQYNINVNVDGKFLSRWIVNPVDIEQA